MQQKITYKWETKEQQDKYWLIEGEKLEEVYNQNKIYYESLGEGIYEKSSCNIAVCSCNMIMHNYIIHNKLNWALEEAERGIMIIKKNLDSVDKNTRLELLGYMVDLYFFLDKNMHDKCLNEYVNECNDFHTRKILKKDQYIYLALDNIKNGGFIKAKEYIMLAIDPRHKNISDKVIIYKYELIYSYIIDYLMDKTRNADMLPRLKDYFKRIFDEEQKGNTRLYGDKMDIYKKDYIIGLRYIWYKYFDGRDWETISPVEVIQSEKYGVKGLQI